MKKFVAGFLCCAILMSGMTVFAEGVTKTIDAVFGQVKLVVDGKAVDKETLLYDGTTYVPLRAAAEALGKEVSYDDASNTAYIGGEPSTQQTNKEPAQNSAASYVRKIVFYTKHPTVPDFGEIFGVNYFYHKEPKQHQSAYAYYVDKLPSDIKDVYISILENAGFTYDLESDTFSDYDSVVAVDYNEEENYITISVVDILL